MKLQKLPKHTTNNNLSKILSKKNKDLVVAVITGFCAAIILLFLWILISLKYHITWIPVAIAITIATLIRVTGKSTHYFYGIYGALLSLCTAIAGNIISLIILYAKYRNKSLSEIYTQLNISLITTLIKTYTRPIDLLMYAGVIYGGFWFSYMHKQNTNNN